MKRLIANHVSKEIHEEVNEQIKDNTLKSRWLEQQATEEFNLAKKIVNQLPIAPTNNLIYKIYNDIKNGKYNDVINDDINIISNYIYDSLKRQGIIFDYRPNNTRKYEHINDVFTKNAKFNNLAEITNPKEYVNTKWYNPYEDQEFIIEDLVNGNEDFILDYFNEDYVDYIGVSDFEDWADNNDLKKIAKLTIPVKNFKNYILKNNCKLIQR